MKLLKGFYHFIIFRKFDVNNDGKLSEEELLPALQSIGFNPSKADIKRLIDAADNDNDGMIDYANQEFVALLEELEDEPYNQVLEAFEYLDKDGDGIITADELRALVSNHGDPMSKVKEKIFLPHYNQHFRRMTLIN